MHGAQFEPGVEVIHAPAMGIARASVQTHVRNLYRNLGTHSQPQAVRTAPVLGQVPGARLGGVRDSRRIGLARPAVAGAVVGRSAGVRAANPANLRLAGCPTYSKPMPASTRR